jgi:hypothetical protein
MQFTYIGNQSNKDVRVAGSFANGAFVTANSASLFANGAFIEANSSFAAANSASLYANGAFTTANNALPKAGGTVTGNVTLSTTATMIIQNTRPTTSNSTGALIVVGGVGIKGNVHTGDIRITGSTSNGLTFVDGTKQYTANVGVSIATSAFSHANAAFNAANNSIIPGGSGNAISFAVDRFTANGATNTFNLSVSTTSNTNTTVVVDGIVQHKNTYTVSDGVITFDSTFENGANIEVTSTTLSTTSFINRTFVGDGTTNNFTISYNTTANSILVFDNGITQNPLTDYTVSGNNLIFVNPPTNGTIIQVRELAPVVNVTYTIDTTVANVAFDTANAAYTHANAAYNQANTGGSDSWVRTQANNAYDTANSAGLYSNGAFTSANTADDKATSAGLYANGAFTKANNTLSLTGGTIAGNVTANSFIANTSVYSPVVYSSGGTTNITLSDIGIVSITSNGQEFKFGAAGIETNKGIYGGSYAGNKLSLDNETRLISNRYDIVKIATGTDGTDYSTWSFSNNQLIFPDNTYQNTAFQGVAIDQTSRNIANSASLYANAAFAAANSGSSSSFAFDQANAAFAHANAAYAQANTSGSSAIDSWVRIQANAAYDTANSASLYANGAFTTANLKFNTSGGTISGDVSITGNLSVLGNTFSTSATQIVANDTLFIMGTGNYTGDILDIGFAGHYNNGTNAHTGLIRDAGTKEWQLFEEYTSEIGGNNNVIITDGSFKIATLNANLKSTTITIKGIDVLPYVNGAFDVANSSAIYANGAFSASNSASSLANDAFSAANSASLYANGAFTKANNALANTSGTTFQGQLNITGTLRALSQGGDEGGEIFLDKAVTNTTLAAGVTIDIFQNKLRFFETGGSVRGAYIDISAASAGVGSDLLSGGGGTTDTTARASAAAAFETANSAGLFANGAFVTANSGASFANAAFAHANAAYAQANTGGGSTTDTYARDTANAAFIQANAAFSQANTGGTSLSKAIAMSIVFGF